MTQPGRSRPSIDPRWVQLSIEEDDLTRRWLARLEWDRGRWVGHGATPAEAFDDLRTRGENPASLLDMVQGRQVVEATACRDLLREILKDWAPYASTDLVRYFQNKLEAVAPCEPPPAHHPV